MSRWNQRNRQPRITGRDMKGRDETKGYIADPDLIEAANVALTCEMPLLLTGEPGCGKTDFAYAVAGELARQQGRSREQVIKDCPIRSDSRARDLLYAYDAVLRFSDAQLRGRPGANVKPDHPGHYIRLEPLGEALRDAPQSVVLIDEIDKAPRDLPNDLLRPLEDRWFEIPEIPRSEDDPTRPADVVLTRRVAREKKLPAPLVIVTSNQEQQLPEPFLRRCVFHHIAFPKPDRLARILRAHFGDGRWRDAAPPAKESAAMGPDEELFGPVVRVVLELRKKKLGLRKQPGTAELLRWVQALREVFDPSDVEERVGAFNHRLASGKAGRELAWGEVPALSCLVKQREDLERLGVLEAPVAPAL